MELHTAATCREQPPGPQCREGDDAAAARALLLCEHSADPGGSASDGRALTRSRRNPGRSAIASRLASRRQALRIDDPKRPVLRPPGDGGVCWRPAIARARRRGSDTLRRICDGVSDREWAAGRQILVLVGRNHPERGCRPDCRGRADCGDIRPVQNGNQNRLVGAEPWPDARRGGRLHRRAWHARRRAAFGTCSNSWSEPEGWRSAFASPTGWNDGVCGTVMRKTYVHPSCGLVTHQA
jgi:hypothetical protein